jgi:hypothetical protein
MADASRISTLLTDAMARDAELTDDQIHYALVT